MFCVTEPRTSTTGHMDFKGVCMVEWEHVRHSRTGISKMHGITSDNCSQDCYYMVHLDPCFGLIMETKINILILSAITS